MSGGQRRKAYSKQALRQFSKDVQSAVLPEIGSAVGGGGLLDIFKIKTCEVPKPKKAKRIEYIHEEIYDPKINAKWTIFNQHAIEIEDQPEEDDELKIMEDTIID